MKILMLSKALLVGAYQKKLEEMAAIEEVDLTVVVPPSWDDPRGGVRLEKVHTNGYEMIVSNIVFNGILLFCGCYLANKWVLWRQNHKRSAKKCVWASCKNL